MLKKIIMASVLTLTIPSLATAMDDEKSNFVRKSRNTIMTPSLLNLGTSFTGVIMSNVSPELVPITNAVRMTTGLWSAFLYGSASHEAWTEDNKEEAKQHLILTIANLALAGGGCMPNSTQPFGKLLSLIGGATIIFKTWRNIF